MNYYAVERSGDHLEHYGVKGMRWGVRKAIEKGNVRALSRQYAKAQKKLTKLDMKADAKVQKENAKKHTRRAIAALGGVGAGLGLSVANYNKAKSVIQPIIDQYEGFYQNYPGGASYFSARRKKVIGQGKPVFKKESIGGGPVGTASSVEGAKAAMNGGGYINRSPNSNPYITRDRIGKAIAAGSLGASIYQAGRAIAAKRRTTKEGHAKAVAKRNAWKKEMNAAFRGTIYDDRKHSLTRRVKKTKSKR